MILQELIEEIRNDLKTKHFRNEAAVSQGIILRVFYALGWPTHDIQVVVPEYAVEGRRVDFALCPSPSKPVVFIEVKQVGNVDGSGRQLAERQLFEYAFHEGVPIAVLTDGRKWHFFHPPGQGNYKQRKVYELDLMEDEESAERLNRYLNYEAVSTGEATKAIKEDYEQEGIQEKIQECLPEAWKKLVEEKNEFLLHALVEKVEKLCEYTPTEDLVLGFLKSLKVDVIPPKPIPFPPRRGQRPRGGRRPSTRLVVTMGDGEPISYHNASDTFVEVIEKLGIERVRDLGIIENGVDLISTIKSDRYGQRKSGPYYIMTNTGTKKKQSLLKEIADGVGVSLTVEIVEK